MYEEEQDDNYEPPPSHTPLATANSASFSGEDYLGGYRWWVSGGGWGFSFAAIALFFPFFSRQPPQPPAPSAQEARLPDQERCQATAGQSPRPGER